MKDVRKNGSVAARHLRGPVWEVRAEAPGGSYRILFSEEGRRSQILLALVPLDKKTQKTPDEAIRLAERRLSDWRSRARRSKA
jgi:phage-related protein